MSDLAKSILDLARARWHTRAGLFFALVGLGIILLTFFSGIDLDSIDLHEWIIIGTVLTVVILAWRVTRLPTAPSSKIGLGVAIQRDGSREATELYSDLLSGLQDPVTSSPIESRVTIVDLPARVARDFEDSRTAEILGNAANVELILFGKSEHERLGVSINL